MQPHTTMQPPKDMGLHASPATIEDQGFADSATQSTEALQPAKQGTKRLHSQPPLRIQDFRGGAASWSACTRSSGWGAPAGPAHLAGIAQRTRAPARPSMRTPTCRPRLGTRPHESPLAAVVAAKGSAAGWRVEDLQGESST